MVGYSSDGKELSHTNHVIAGGLSGVITRAFTQPLDVLKIRFQLQVEPISRASEVSKYRGRLHSLKTIFREEKWFAFWKGHLGSQGLTAMYMSVQFASFEVLTKAFAVRFKTKEKTPIIHFISGGGAGAFATIVSYPLDVIRTRFIAQGNDKLYNSFYGAMVHMYKMEGLMAFYRGLWAAILQSAPQVALTFGSYALFKQTLKPVYPYVGKGEDGLNAVCGAASGITAKLIVYPIDTGKRRLQIIGFADARKSFGVTKYYNGIFDFLMTAAKEEGVKGLYKGVSWSLVKAGVSTSMFFFFYEKITNLMKKYKYSDTDF